MKRVANKAQRIARRKTRGRKLPFVPFSMRYRRFMEANPAIAILVEIENERILEELRNTPGIYL